ncbi:MAG: hypothetical protein V3U71_05510 [Cocleimonas sp.]
MSETINHNALRHLIEANAVTSACAEANGDIWSLKVLVADSQKTVMAKNSGEPRKWRKLDTLAKYLKQIGLNSFEINVTNFDPAVKSLKRPDSATTLKRTHREAHQSFKEKTQKTAKLFPEETALERVKERWEERRSRILKEENPRAK